MFLIQKAFLQTSSVYVPTYQSAHVTSAFPIADLTLLMRIYRSSHLKGQNESDNYCIRKTDDNSPEGSRTIIP